MPARPKLKPEELIYTEFCCTKCKIIKNLEEFELVNKTARGHRTECYDCRLEYARQHRKLYPEKAKIKNRRNNIKYQQLPTELRFRYVKGRRLQQLYKMSLETYEQMLEEQNHVCDICLGPPLTRKLGVDHCHTTGKIRGLLCIRCNTGIGKFKDDVEILKRVLAYLEKHRA